MKSINNHASRRKFIRHSLLGASMLPFLNAGAAWNTGRPPSKLKVFIFSKHLQFLGYQDMANAAADMGFDGVDITVRPGGHVEPADAVRQLPKAVDALRHAGLKPVMITTAVDDADDPADKNVLQAAAANGFTHYRMNWYPYPDNIPMPEALAAYRQKVKKLGELNRELKLTGVYQNHAGLQIGSSLWEVWELLRDTDPKHMGVQYDIRHATVEGFSSWQNGLKLVSDRIRMLTIKDFKWGNENNRWIVEDTPMGEGMIDFVNYFRLLKQYRIDVPVSLHIEYPLGGVEDGAKTISIDKKEVFNAMKKDLRKVQEFWQQA